MALITLLFVLGVCGSLASGDVVKSAPPEDLDDVSGDDEDFSGSGLEFSFVDADSKDGDVHSTPISHLVSTVPQVSTAPEVAPTEVVTPHSPTTQPHDPIIDIDVDTVEKEGTAPEPTTLQTSTVESVYDVKKPGHHSTTVVTAIPEKFDVIEETTVRSGDVEKPFVFLEETTTSTPDEGDSDGLILEVTTPEGAVQHVDHPETTSGLASTPYAENEETTSGPVDEIPLFVDSVEATTVTDDTHTSKQHHGGHHHHHTHHPHHHHHHTTTPDTITQSSTVAIPLDEADIFEMEKPGSADPEDNQTEATTLPPPFSGDEHHEHHDHKHHHHTTTPEAAQSTVSEQSIVQIHDSKGRRVNVPHAGTTAAPAQSEEKEPIASTVQSNQDEDAADSIEEESGNGPVELTDSTDIYFVEATVPGLNRMEPPGDGSSDASHGIMDRKELLAAIIAGGLAGLVFAASLVAFVLYRMKKKDEGSYSLEEPKQSNGGYQKPREQREFYA